MLRWFLITVFLLSFAGRASAGGVEVYNPVGTLSAQEVHVLTTGADTWTFNLKAGFVSVATKQDLESVASKCVQTAVDLCAYVDAGHRWVSVHFGTNTGVPRTAYNQVAAAGNAFFKAGNWVAGILNIADASMKAIQQAEVRQQANPAPMATAVETKDTGTSPLLIMFLLFFGALALVGVIAAIVSVVKKQKKIDADMFDLREERKELTLANGQRMVENDKPDRSRQTFAPTPTPSVETRAPTPRAAPRPRPAAPAPMRPAPVIIQQQSNNDLLTGVLIGQATAPRERVVERVVERRRDPEPEVETKKSDDSGSGSSFFGGLSSVFSSSDSGGGSSSFGGGDSGGGGFDGGGGSSDF